MNTVLDNSLVGLALLASFVYAAVTLAPRNARRRVLGRLAQWLAHAPSALRLNFAAQRLARAAADKASGACGGCDNCGPASENQSRGGEISVPLASIARVRRPPGQE
jgi:hypothetical protein